MFSKLNKTENFTPGFICVLHSLVETSNGILISMRSFPRAGPVILPPGVQTNILISDFYALLSVRFF